MCPLNVEPQWLNIVSKPVLIVTNKAIVSSLINQLQQIWRLYRKYLKFLRIWSKPWLLFMEPIQFSHTQTSEFFFKCWTFIFFLNLDVFISCVLLNVFALSWLLNNVSSIKEGNPGPNRGLHYPCCGSHKSWGLAVAVANSRQWRDDDLEIGQTTT